MENMIQEYYLLNPRQISDLHLHDQSLKRINISLSLRKIDLEFQIFDDIKKKYEVFEISFQEVEQINFEGINFILSESIEIYSCDVILIDDNKFQIKFIFLLGFGQPSMSFHFEFKHCYYKSL
jgi:hypothetical protein